MYFTSPTWGRMSLQEVTHNVRSYLVEDPQASYKIVIGTDSQTSHRQTIFVTALIIHRIGKGARFYFQKVSHKPLYDLTYRIYKETEYSLSLIEALKSQGATDIWQQWPIEIHLDIGPHGDTKKLIQEVVGWVTSVGYDAKIKPASFGASSVADRFTS